MDDTFASYESPLGMLEMEVKGGKLIYLEIFPYGYKDDYDDPLSQPNELTDVICQQVLEYVAGERTEFDVEIDYSRCTPFQCAVYSELLKIPYGATRSYKEIAIAIGNPRASRAVGVAANHNPIHIIVPCHRVIGSRGALTGYAAGIETKENLLTIEQHYLAKK